MIPARVLTKPMSPEMYRADITDQLVTSLAHEMTGTKLTHTCDQFYEIEP